MSNTVNNLDTVNIDTNHTSDRSDDKSDDKSSSGITSFLELKLRDRVSLIKNLVSSLIINTRSIESDIELRSQYTNRSIISRYQKSQKWHESSESSESSESNDSPPPLPPLLLRQYNIETSDDRNDILEANSNIRLEYKKSLIDICNFTEEEIKYMIGDHISILRLHDEVCEDGGLSVNTPPPTFPILCDIEGVTHTLKYAGGEFPDKRGFFFTPFIIEDNITPIFDKIFPFSLEGGRSVSLKVD
jgi:hypothetical protein